MGIDINTNSLYIDTESPYNTTTDIPVFSDSVSFFVDPVSGQLMAQEDDGVIYPIQYPVKLMSTYNNIEVTNSLVYAEPSSFINPTTGMVQIDFWPKPEAKRMAVINGWSSNGVGMSTDSLTANAAAFGGAFAGNTSFQQITTLASAASAAFVSHAYSDYNIANVGTAPIEFGGVIRHAGTNTSIRQWLAFAQFTNWTLGFDTLSNGIGFRFSSVAGDTTWKAVFNSTVVDTGVTVPAAATTFYMRVRLVSLTKAYFSINDGNEIEVNSGTPLDTSANYKPHIVVIAQAASARSILYSRIYVEY